MDINDTLKLKAYGWKKDMLTKAPHIQSVLEHGQQYYPPDPRGVIDEWDGLMKHQHNMMTQRDQSQQMIDKERKKQYSDYLDWQMKEKQRMKDLEREKDLIDNQRQSKNLNSMDNIKKGKMDEDKIVKSYIASQLKSEMDKNNQNRYLTRQEAVARERDQIEKEKVNPDIENENQRQTKQKHMKEQEEIIQFKNYLRDQDKETKINDQNRYLKECAQNNERKSNQDERWYRYYKDFDRNMSQKLLEHEQKYLIPGREREMKSEYTRDQQFGEAEKAKWQRELKDRDHQKEMAKQIYDGNFERLGLKKQMAETVKEKDRLFADQKQLEQNAAMQRAMEDAKMSKDQKDFYAQTLKQQILLRDQTQNDYGKMTFQEKRINRTDLDSYKQFEPKSNSIVPGINHLYSIGSKPLAHGALTQIYGVAPIGHQKGHIFASPKNNSALSNYNSTNNGHQSVRESMMQRSQSDIKMLDKNQFEKLRQQSHTPRNGNSITRSGDPILQPVDSGISNPYLKRQLKQFVSQNGAFKQFSPRNSVDLPIKS